MPLTDVIIDENIRYHKPNDPYYWEVDNLPLVDIMRNMVLIADGINLAFDNVYDRETIEALHDGIQATIDNLRTTDLADWDNNSLGAGTGDQGKVGRWTSNQFIPGYVVLTEIVGIDSNITINTGDILMSNQNGTEFEAVQNSMNNMSDVTANSLGYYDDNTQLMWKYISGQVGGTYHQVPGHLRRTWTHHSGHSPTTPHGDTNWQYHLNTGNNGGADNDYYDNRTGMLTFSGTWGPLQWGYNNDYYGYGAVEYVDLDIQLKIDGSNEVSQHWYKVDNVYRVEPDWGQNLATTYGGTGTSYDSMTHVSVKVPVTSTADAGSFTFCHRQTPSTTSYEMCVRVTGVYTRDPDSSVIHHDFT